MPKKSDSSLSMTPAERALRIIELEEMIDPAVAELEVHRAWMKENIPIGEFPGDGFTVKRWEQIGALIEDEFKKAYPLKKNPELWRKLALVEKMRELLPIEDYPEAYGDAVDPNAAKELLTEEEKKTFFKQAQYLKIIKD